MPSREFTVGLAQMAPVLGDVETNLKAHEEWVRRALKEGVKLLCFPELSLTGYVLRDLVPHVAIRAEQGDPTWDRLLALSKEASLVVGFVEEDARHRFFASQAFLGGGKSLHIHRKVYLPTYGLFEEGRYLAPGRDFRAFDTPFGRVGMLICEDAWHLSSPYVLWAGGADILIIASSSPGYGIGVDQGGGTDNGDATRLFSRSYARFLTAFVIHAHRVGIEEGVSFYGGSLVIAPTGKVIVEAPLFEEALLTAQIDLLALRQVRRSLPLLRDEKLLVVHHELGRILSQGRRV